MRASHTAKFQHEPRNHSFDLDNDLRCKVCWHQWIPAKNNNASFPCLTSSEKREAEIAYKAVLAEAVKRWIKEEDSVDIICFELDIPETDLVSAVRDAFNCHADDISTLLDVIGFYLSGVPSIEISARVDRAVITIDSYISVYQELTEIKEELDD